MEENREEQTDQTWWSRARVLLFFLIGLAALDAVIVASRETWRRYDPDDYREKILGVRQHPHELVLIGGSPVAEGIEPAAFLGMDWAGQPVQSVYNLGLPGATTTEVWHSIKHGLRSKPRLVIYGITASDLNDNRQEPHGPWSLMNGSDLLDWLRIKKKSNEWVIRQFVQSRISWAWNLWFYRNGIRLWAADQVEQVWPGSFESAAADARHNLRYVADVRRPDGFAPLPKHQVSRLDEIKDLLALAANFRFLDGYRVGDHVAYLHRILDWADQNRVDLVLVDMPVSKPLEERFFAPAFATYREALANVERSRPVKVLRASRKATAIGDSDFADLIHLNASGTKKLSGWIRQQLTSP
jgi:hypothetical protein